MTGNFLPSSTLHGAAELLIAHGGDPKPLMTALHMDAEALHKPDIPVPAGAVGTFLERAGEAAHCRSFGIRLALRSGMAILGPLWVLLRNAETVGQMFEDLAGHYELFTTAAAVTMESADGGVFVGWDTAAGLTGSSIQAVEFVIALFCNEIRLRADPQWTPSLVQFRHSPPAQLHDHQQVFGSRIQFQGERNALFLDQATLALPVNGSGARSRALLSSMLRLDQDALNAGISRRVEGVVRALLPYAPCSLQDVSRVFGMAPRTLQEHLSSSETSFKVIKDQVRSDLALKYLQQSSLSLSEIADILGYGALSSFSHSFRRWHGCSASAFRRQAAM
ncbi:AraC family transcriptional regulator [Alcanivorax sp. S6407]|uniref:AraC family transcriptional regulator n=1 Tax=Alcanivorax sp. S6407 TaxID=2926424 RepID=UPI001FF14005|nr:AraC family transcriptional regulator [Alcanivorax sp. S6407]MCK0155349.1 AraC family transcriptional regulator [Alcanivorax sp. S6407]